jgi:enterobactin synthetase component D
MLHTKQEAPLNYKFGFITDASPIKPLNFSGLVLECQFDQDNYQDDLFSKLGIQFPSEITHAYKKRKAEFLAGRYCAHLALSYFGLMNTPIPIGPNRSPLWPADIAGSITHADNLAICAINNKPQALGIDYEPTIAINTANKIKSHIINRAEEALLSKSGLPFRQWMTIAFSTKESLFKALYPTVKQYFDFLDAEIVHIDCKNHKLVLTIKCDLCTAVSKGQLFSGTYRSHREGIITLVEHQEFL